MPISSKSLCILTAAGALGLALTAVPASARSYDRYDSAQRNDSPEQVEVFAPRYRHERSATSGAPIRTVSLSRGVRADDLDLTTRWGARELRARIRTTASTLCDRLDTRYPITVQDGHSCYRAAVADAMYRADEAIADARDRD